MGIKEKNEELMIKAGVDKRKLKTAKMKLNFIFSCFWNRNTRNKIKYTNKLISHSERNNS